MREIFVRSLEELEKLECEYNLENCGCSGQYPGWTWLQDDDTKIAVYFKNEDSEIGGPMD